MKRRGSKVFERGPITKIKYIITNIYIYISNPEGAQVPLGPPPRSIPAWEGYSVGTISSFVLFLFICRIYIYILEWRIEGCVNVCIDWLKKSNMAKCYWWLYNRLYWNSISLPRYQSFFFFFFGVSPRYQSSKHVLMIFK